MTNETTYPRQGDRKPLELSEIEERCVKYVRNALLGLGIHVNLIQLKDWLKADVCLSKLPSDTILMRWLAKWDFDYLVKWSYDNDHANQTKSN